MPKNVTDNINNLMNLFPEQPLVDKIIYSMVQYVPDKAQTYRLYLLEHVINFLKQGNNHCKYKNNRKEVHLLTKTYTKQNNFLNLIFIKKPDV